MHDRLVLVEFNELCPSLLDAWMAQGKLPNFKRFHEDSQVFVTSPCVPEQEYLEPWIQWYSMHTGLAYDQHKVFHLADGPGAGYPDVWSVLGDHDIPVGNCSSMNARGFQTPGSYFLPDPWCTSESAFPADLNHFHDFVSFLVREYSNDNAQLDRNVAINFLKFMVSHGLQFGTVCTIVNQLLKERVVDKRHSWKRVAIMDQLLFDVFCNYQKRFKPRFSTFFVNSTAHLQHAYWRNMEPQKFEVQPAQADQKFYGDAILYGYQQMDRLIGQFMDMASDDTLLVFATALSQTAFLRGEGIGGQRFYRPKDVGSFLKKLGIAFAELQPVMTNQFQIRFASQEEMRTAQSILEHVTCEGKKAFALDDAQENSIYFGCHFHHEVARDATLIANNGAEPIPFYDVFYMIDATKSGFHHPDGALWIRNGVSAVHADKASVLDVFPTVLEFFGIDLPEIEHPYRGRSLLPLMRADQKLQAA